MCGRFVASRPVEDIVGIFGVDDIEVPEELTLPRWNIAPTAGVLAVRERLRAGDTTPERRRGLTDFRWGLVPSWAKHVTTGARAFNARAETVIEKASFRTALSKRRCLIPAEAFYEWRRTPAAPGKGGGREAWGYASPRGDVLAFAGLYEVWKPADPTERDDLPGWHDDWLLSCTIITTDANEVVAPVHDRMPVILEPADWEAWLDPGKLDPSDVTGMLRPARAGVLDGFRVSSAVNHAQAEGPELIEPITPADQPTLFG